MYELKEKTKKMAAFTVGINYEQFIDFDYSDELAYINQSNTKKCDFLPEDDERIIGRGNPLLARNEFLTMDEVNKELDGE